MHDGRDRELLRAERNDTGARRDGDANSRSYRQRLENTALPGHSLHGLYVLSDSYRRALELKIRPGAERIGRERLVEIALIEHVVVGLLDIRPRKVWLSEFRILRNGDIETMLDWLIVREHFRVYRRLWGSLTRASFARRIRPWPSPTARVSCSHC